MQREGAATSPASHCPTQERRARDLTTPSLIATNHWPTPRRLGGGNGRAALPKKMLDQAQLQLLSLIKQRDCCCGCKWDQERLTSDFPNIQASSRSENSPWKCQDVMVPPHRNQGHRPGGIPAGFCGTAQRWCDKGHCGPGWPYSPNPARIKAWRVAAFPKHPVGMEACS